jgi:uncharacterized protein (TIGR03086 family)
MDLLNLARRAHEDTGKIIGTLSAGDWESPTPCAEWAVRDVVRHLIDNNERFAALADERERFARQPSDGRLLEAFTESSAELLGVFGAEAQAKPIEFGRFGTLPGRRALGALFVDVLVHGWDLDTAIGREHHWDDELATVALSIAGRYPNAAPVRGPGGAFALALEAPPDATPGERLIALLGRSVC